MTEFRTVSLSSRSKRLHIEAPGCIVNITPGLTDKAGRPVVHISISADGNRYQGNPQWWVNGEAGATGVALRIIQTDTPSAPAPHPSAAAFVAARAVVEQAKRMHPGFGASRVGAGAWIDLAKLITAFGDAWQAMQEDDAPVMPAIPLRLLSFLAPYVSGDDVGLPKAAFLRLVADRINDDLMPLPCPGASEAPIESSPDVITNEDETIHSADIDARIAHLLKLRQPGPVDLGWPDNDTAQDQLFAELGALEAVKFEGKQIAGDWGGSAVLIRDDFWDDWAVQTAKDVGIPVADVTKNDYVMLDFGGVTYWVRG